MNIGIEFIDYYIPSYRIDVTSYFKIMKDTYGYKKSWDDINFFIENSKYSTIAIENEKSRIQMLEVVFQKVLNAGIQIDKIDLVIYSTDILESYQEKIVYQIKLLKEFGFHHSNYFTMNQQCGTQLNALNLADSFIRTNKARKVMIVSHNYKKAINQRLIEGYGIAGDGAAVAIVSNHCDKLKIKKAKTLINNRYYDLNHTPTGGMQYFEYLTNGVTCIKQMLDQYMDLRDIQMIIPQNVSAVEWDFCCSRLQYDIKNVFLDNVSRYGHIGDADALINLKDALESNRLEKGKHLILQSIGAGATFNSLLIQY